MTIYGYLFIYFASKPPPFIPEPYNKIHGYNISVEANTLSDV